MKSVQTQISEYLSVFSPNTGKYGPEITPYLDTFHTVKDIPKRIINLKVSRKNAINKRMTSGVHSSQRFKIPGLYPHSSY